MPSQAAPKAVHFETMPSEKILPIGRNVMINTRVRCSKSVEHGAVQLYYSRNTHHQKLTNRKFGIINPRAKYEP